MAEVDVRLLLSKINPAEPRQAHEMLASALHEYRMRVEREKQAQPGGLYAFIEYFWDTIEPGRQLVDGWPLRAMCMHLEAITYGHITRLLVNVSPGSMKSLLLNVFWPAWEWSAAGHPGMRYISFSYSSLLTERDNQRMLDLIESPKFQDLWGHMFTMRQKGVTKISNSKFGWKFASSVRGTGTGERADRVLCFPHRTFIATEHGPMAIGDIVKERRQIRVWSRNMETGRVELRPVTGWRHNPGSPLVKISLSNGGSVRCTPGHRFWTRRGWICAGDMSPGSPRPDGGDSLARDVKSLRQNHRAFSRCKYLSNLIFRKKSAWSGMGVSRSYSVSFWKVQMEPRGSVKYPTNSREANSVFSSEVFSSFRMSFRNFTDKFIGKMRRAVTKSSIALAVRDVLRPRPIFEIAQTRVSPVVVFMPDLLPLRTWTNERQRDESMDKDILGAAVQAEGHARIPLIKRSRHQTALFSNCMSFSGVSVPVGVRRRTPLSSNGSGFTPHSTIVGDQVIGITGGVEPDFLDVIGIVADGHVNDTFCLTVEGNHNMFVGDNQGKLFLASNCDDPHNIKEGESQTIREETVRWFKEAMSNRLNHMTKSAIVVIMQRVHSSDVSGEIISNDLGYEHLMIPMLYEQGRHCSTSIGWTDPRSIDGENFWPERFPPEAVDECLKLGDHAFASQYQQRPSPRGGGIFKNEYWNIWEPEDGKYPKFDFILGSVDPAYTHHDENDPSAMTIWGLNYADDGTPRVFLIAAWRKWLQLHGPTLVKEYGEPDYLFFERQKKEWGLVEWISHTCKRFQVDHLLIESKASGISVMQEMQRLLFQEKFGMEFVDPGRADKEVRANRVQHIFSAGMIYRPDRPWATMVEDEMAEFPKSRYDDLLDTACYALYWLRQHNMLTRREELKAANDPKAGNQPGGYRDHVPLYPM